MFWPQRPIFSVVLCFLSLSFSPCVFSEPIRQLAPASKCTLRVFNHRNEAPREIPDRSGSCPPKGSHRAFLLNEDANPARPSLQEVQPHSRQRYQCLKGKKCFLHIAGFGLEAGDGVLLIKEAGTCGTNDTQEIWRTEVKREAATRIVLTYDEAGRAIRTTRVYAVVEIPAAQLERAVKMKVCYSPSLTTMESVEDQTPQQFFYWAGVLHTGPSAFSCDFEGGSIESCGFTSYKESYDLDFSWTVQSGPSTTPGTGPLSDFTHIESGDGHYALMNSPGYLSDGAAAIMMGPPMMFSEGDYCISFAYNMHGDDVNSLRVYLGGLPTGIRLLEGNATENSSDSWGAPKWVAVGNKGEDWHKGGFNVHFTDSHSSQLVFEALAGRSEKGDIALDDLSILSGDCPAQFREMPRSRVGTKDMICGEVRMTTGHHPADKMWSLDGAISCAGRGYSVAQVEHAWVPCCVPHFGNYTLLLHDRMNDGWEGSTLEIRFFDRLMSFGDEMKRASGDLRLPVIIGQLQIQSAEFMDDGIHAEIKVVNPNQHVWCGVSEASPDGSIRTPVPHSSLMKQYGVRSSEPTREAGELIEIRIRNPPELDPFIHAHAQYDLYCYAEPADYDIMREMNETDISEILMDDNQIAATRFRITADDTPPILKATYVEVNALSVTIKVQSDEPAKVWCYPFMKKRYKHQEVTRETLMAVGHIVKFEDAVQTATFEFEHLASDTDYQLYCYAEDFALPKVHATSPEDVKSGGISHGQHNATVDFHTQKRVPQIKILRATTLSHGFDVFVEMDAPGNVWCAAAPEALEFPTVGEVKEAGAKAKLAKEEFSVGPHTQLKISIRGVQEQTAYKIFCAATTSDGSMSTREKDMWRNVYPVVSYGKFCDIPGSPPISERSSQATPFDPINSDEELKVRRYILSQKDLGIEGVYRVNLLPNKTEIYDHFLHNGPFPKRYARIRAGRCIEERGFYEQIKVGPIDGPEEKFGWERIAKPVETTCGGYVPEGIFGRRLQAGGHAGFQRVLRESFGHPFNTENCAKGHEICLKLGSIALETPSAGTRKLLVSSGAGVFWVGLKHPTGIPLPFYFAISPRDLGLENIEHINPSSIPRRLDGKDWLANHRQVWYNGHMYDSVDALAGAYERGEAPKITMSNINDRIANERNQYQATRVAKRRLAPAPYAGAAGTAGVDLDRSRKRAGLEYRIPPEHVEPEGKRFTIKSHPGGQSFSIDYAGWSFTVTNDRDKSLQFWNLRFQNEQLAFQLGLQEALAHYTVSERTFFFMDSWYGGLGGAARPVLRGYECPKHGVLVFWDQSLCVWEQDMARPIRSHYRAGEIRDAAGHYALHVRQMLTVSNYDYVTTYIFHSSGHIEMKVEFTGELYAGIEVPWWSQRQQHYGTQVTGSMRFAALHAHLVVWRIDFDLGENYQDNSVYFEEVIPDPKRIGANYITRYFAEKETEAVIGVNATRQIAYEIVDENRDTYGNYGGWRIFPGHSLSPNAPNFELYSGPAAWAKYKAFTTVFKYSELDATLPRDNKFAGDPAVCVDRYIHDNETLRHTDLVTWMSMSFMHIPCSEDYPLTIPIGNTLSALIRPNNWFLEDPSMDLHNAIGGDFEDPGQCAVVRRNLFEAMDVSHGHGPILL